MIKKTCQFCSKTFWVPLYRKNLAHFCSHACYNKYRAKIAYPKKECPYCNKAFSINRETRNNQYCCQKCRYLSQRKHSREIKNCLFCGKKMKYNPKNPLQKYCGQLCNAQSRAYKVKNDYFDKIDCEDKAYLLGLIFADGSVSGQRLTLSSKDKKLIEDCKLLLRSDAPVYNYNNHFYLIIGNQKLYNSLKNLGVMERKSWKEYGIPTLPKHLIRHFLRGFFDGDGSFYISYHERKYHYLCASFSCGSRRFLSEIRQWLDGQNIKTHKIRFDNKGDNKGSWQLKMARIEAIKNFVNLLYDDSHYYLERKFAIVNNYYGGKI